MSPEAVGLAEASRSLGSEGGVVSPVLVGFAKGATVAHLLRMWAATGGKRQSVAKDGKSSKEETLAMLGRAKHR